SSCRPPLDAVLERRARPGETRAYRPQLDVQRVRDALVGASIRFAQRENRAPCGGELLQAIGEPPHQLFRFERGERRPDRDGAAAGFWIDRIRGATPLLF